MSLDKLQDALYDALKSWHDATATTSPLAYLRLFRQARLNGAATPRQTTNQILLKALETLAHDHGSEAEVLRLHFLDGLVVYTIANRLNVNEATVYRWQKRALKRLAWLVQTQEAQAKTEQISILEKRLLPQTYTHLIGVERHLDRLLEKVTAAEPLWLISIEGLGGLGKTALADALVRNLMRGEGFVDIAWVSAKQQEFYAAFDQHPTLPPALDSDTLVNSLLEQLRGGQVEATSPQAKMVQLSQLLSEAPHLIVIDNLETIQDYETLLPTLRKLANPSRVLLTSRHSLQGQPDVFCFTLPELSQDDTVTLLRYEAEARGFSALATAPKAQLVDIYEVVGGNPLALKLVVGQMGIWSLPQLLENLKKAQGKKIEALYTYIYWHAWRALEPVAQHVLLLMPLAQEGDFDQLKAVSKLAVPDLNDALERLVTLSLVEVGGELTDRRYRIHRLTETFLLTEVTKWQASS